MTKQKNRRLTALLLVLVTLAAVYFGAGDLFTVRANAGKVSTNAAIQQIEKELGLIESKISNLEKQQKSAEAAIANSEDALEAEKAYKATLDEKLSLVAESIATTKKLIAAYDTQISEKEQEIEDKNTDIQEQYENVLAWIRMDYECGTVNYLDMIFSSDGFSEFLSSVELFASMMEYQTSVMDGLNSDLIRLRSEKEALDSLRQQQNAVNDKLAVQQQNYEALIAKSSSYMKELEEKISQYQDSVDAATKQQEKLNADLAALDAELKEELAKLAKQNAKYVGGKFIWPTDATKYNRVSSPFGWRVVNGVKNNHLGIDIPCAYGADIWAANAGTVVKATFHYSYGYYVVIDHGGGITTLYAHNSRLLVKQGDIVEQGQEIAQAGATGNAYGNHLHFEVRVNGEAVNPLDGYVSVPG